jgi:hypothetical protein
MNIKIWRKWIFLMGLMVVCLSFMIPADAQAKAGDSWNRAIYNKSDQTVTITVAAHYGNVWFTGACSTENGPCKMPPHSTANIKYTTTYGATTGTFKINYGTNPQCEITYMGGSQSSAPAPRFFDSTCGYNIRTNNPSDGYMTIE